MEVRHETGRLAERLALAALLITLAGLLWLAGTAAAYSVSCPGGSAAGADTQLSAWPPGRECAAAGGGVVVEPLVAGIEWGIVGLAFLGAAVLLLAVLAEIRRLRRPPARLSRPWTSRSPTSRATSSPQSGTSAGARSGRPSSASA